MSHNLPLCNPPMATNIATLFKLTFEGPLLMSFGRWQARVQTVSCVGCTVIQIPKYCCMHSHDIWQEKDQPGKVSNPALGQLNREDEYFPVPVRA